MLQRIEVPDEIELARRLATQLADRLPTGSMISPWKRGADYAALMVAAPGRRLVLRVPLREVAPSEYDGTVDFGAVLEREVTAHRVLGTAGVPVPELLDWQRATEATRHSWMLLEYVQHDELTDLGASELAQLGDVLARLHRVRPADADAAILGQVGSPTAMADRLALRVAALAERVPLAGHRSVIEAARTVLSRRSHPAGQLLHMDLRPDNLCFRHATLTAILDLSNTTTGDPAAELGRMRAYGLLRDPLIAAYRASGHQLPDDATIAAYATDPFALLGLLGTDEFADHALVDRAVSGLAWCRSVLC